MHTKKLSSPEKWILIIIPIIFLIGSSLHFTFELSGKNILVGFFSAVNESVWEHSKMLILPILLFWFIYYCLKARKYDINKDEWFLAALSSLLTALIIMPMLYYFYTGAFGVEFLIIDILILLIVIALGQVIGLHVYKYSKGIKWYISAAIYILIILLFIYLTLYPLQIPIFMDHATGQYGIIK